MARLWWRPPSEAFKSGARRPLSSSPQTKKWRMGNENVLTANKSSPGHGGNLLDSRITRSGRELGKRASVLECGDGACGVTALACPLRDSAEAQGPFPPRKRRLRFASSPYSETLRNAFREFSDEGPEGTIENSPAFQRWVP